MDAMSGIPVIGGVYGGIQAGRRERKFEKELEGMPDPQYRPSRQLLDFYQEALDGIANPEGLSTEELNTARNETARGQTTAFRRGQEVAGGNFGQSFNYALNSGNLGMYNNLARLNAQRRMQNLGYSYGMLGNSVNMFQDLSNRNTGLYANKLNQLGLAQQQARLEKQGQYQRVGQEGLQVAGMAMGMAGGMPGGAPGGGGTMGTGAGFNAGMTGAPQTPGTIRYSSSYLRENPMANDPNYNIN